MLPFAAAGVILGGVLGYWFRTAARLSLTDVMSQGGSLRGVDRLLIPAAQASFNRVLLFAAIGMIAAVFANWLLRRVR